MRERLGEDAVVTDHRCESVDQDGAGAVARFTRTSDGAELPDVRADVVVACDGVHSAVRRQFYPDEGEPRYSGVTMWRGTTVAPPFLTGASMARIGWLASGKMVVYPIRDIDDDGNQLVNWVAEPAATGRGRAAWRTSWASSRTGRSTGWTSPRSSRAPRPCSSTRWWTRTRSRAGPSAG